MGRRLCFTILALALLSLPLAAEEGPAPVEDRYFDSDGVKIRYTVQGDGEPVVLVHGFTASIETNWGAPGIIAALAPEFKVIAMDARGHGKSDKPHDPAAYGAKMAEDVIRLLDHLGIAQAHLVGYSMGGGIVLQVLTSHPERVHSAVLGGAGWRPPGSGFESLMTPLAESLEQGKGIGPLIIALNPAGQPPPTEEMMAAINQRLMASNDPLALAAVIRGGLAGGGITEETLRQSKVPTFAVVGAIDPVKAGVVALVGVMPDLEVKVLPGKDHLTAVPDPELASSIKGFLMRTSAEVMHAH